MGLHGRNDVRKVVKRLGEVFLYQKIYRMTTRRNDDVSVFVFEHPVIFVFDDSRADGSLLYVVKAELFQSLSHRLNADAVVICYKRRGKAYENGVGSVKKNLCFFGFVYNLFCILRTYHEALTAEYTFVADNMRLIPRKANGFYRAVTYTFVAVFTVGFFKSKAIGHNFFLKMFIC